MPYVTIHIKFEGEEEQRARAFSVGGEVCDFGKMLGEVLSNVDLYVNVGAGYQVARAIKMMETHCPDLGDDFNDLVIVAKRTVREIDEQAENYRKLQHGEPPDG